MKPKVIHVIIEKSQDIFSGYSTNVKGLTGSGDSVSEVKQAIVECMILLKDLKTDKSGILNGEYTIDYSFDTASMLDYFKGIITQTALSARSGINQKQINHYYSGLRKPRAEQKKKIENTLHELGRELLQVHLI
ncbi:MAG: helix-turn-helix transcriptional regulator [Bacteroidota bacterium]